MIEINLLPGAKKAKRARGPAFNVGEALSGVMSQIKDGFLIVGVAAFVIGAAATAFMYWRVSGRESGLQTSLQTATQDSVRFAQVLRDREVAQAQRDSVVRQLSIIRTIDGERFTWPHILDELSEALPAYTWLKSVVQTSPVLSIVTRDSVSGAAAQRIETMADAAVAAASRMQLRVVGQTVDIQAMTRFYAALEASPFIEGVTLIGTRVELQEGREITEFTLDMTFQQPDPSAIRTVPLSVAVR